MTEDVQYKKLIAITRIVTHCIFFVRMRLFLLTSNEIEILS